MIEDGDVEDLNTNSQTFLRDVARRLEVERVAVKVAIKFYEENGFTVEEKGKPYDLLCVRGSLVVHVEVKGTQGDGAKIILTKNEIADAKKPSWRSDLFIVRDIKLVEINKKWVGTPGSYAHHEAWLPKDDDLIATQFEYKVPNK